MHLSKKGAMTLAPFYDLSNDITYSPQDILGDL